MIIIFIYSIFLAVWRSNLDPDFGWHLFLGKKMVESGSLIHDHIGYNSRLSQIATIDHEWLSDLLLYLGYDHFGYLFLILFFFILLFAVFYFLDNVLKSLKINSDIRLGTISVIFLSMIPLYGVRLQVLIWLGAAIALFIHYKIASRRIRYIAYFILFLVGNNLHAGYLPLVVIPLFLETEWQTPIKILFRKNIINLISLGAILLLAISLNINGLGYWSLVLDMTVNRGYLKGIQEWLPVYSIPPLFLVEFILPLVFFIFLLAVNSYWKKLKPNELALIAIFAYLGIQSRRNFPLFMVVATPTLALATQSFIGQFATNAKKQGYFLYSSIMLFLIGLFIFANIPSRNFNVNTLKDPWSEETDYPVGATKFLSEEMSSDDNLFNPYEWGGYLLWRNPGLKVFIDGRGPQSQIPGKEATLLEEYNKFLGSDQEVMRQKLDEYNISIVLARKYQPSPLDPLLKTILKFSSPQKIQSLEHPRNNLLEFLRAETEWAKVYEDTISVVFTR